ncbi:MAG: tRNA pseudouridine(55) synthase TruB, partial [Planctomycetes bacterium]|nr:tRNA pseudouridine(55) synthase TruB [Planctomycetota bacterium]
ADIDAVLITLTGVIDQRPPKYSACKIDGQPAYKRARAGEVVEVRMKQVRIDALEIMTYNWPLLDLRITCGRGTYIRSLARQIGEALGTGGYLARLVRTAVGPYKIEDAIALADVPEPLTEADLLPLPEPVQPELDPKSGPEAVANESQSQGQD